MKQRSKKNLAEFNKEINLTGGGAYKRILTEQDAQVLAMVAPQVQPLSNVYDDAALYFDNHDATHCLTINNLPEKENVPSAATSNPGKYNCL
ncbi:hypothetical protein RR46_00091 [Papilio xuthus]|uniref:Uncharacterized protein n=1 Tax=Papilio xuthus TaxID=66420 RepID=A0A0N0PF02_PAPXU|nr:hypothetical protein RR46_00091 [Papilio xuthus]